MNEISLSVLSLNCWSIPYISKHRNARMNAIAEKFVSGEYDVVCLQEVWSVNDFEMLRAKTQDQLPYSHYFYSGVVGSGICIFSRYPIEDVMFHQWSLNGYVHKIHHGDWFGGKGVGLCKIKVQTADVNIYVAHLHAEYDKENDEYTAHRVFQAFDTAQFIRMTRGGADAVILAGDLNTEPQDLAYRIICGSAGLLDACSSTFKTLGTNECANNSYTDIKLARRFPAGKRIDYILYYGSKNYKVEVTNFQHPFPKRVPFANFSYSDHEAIMASFKLTPGVYETIEGDVRESLKEAVAICELALETVQRQRIWYLLSSCFLVIPLILSMGLDTAAPLAVSVGLNVLRILLTAVLCYALFMSTIWNMVEKNGLKAACCAMEMQLNKVNNNINERIV